MLTTEHLSAYVEQVAHCANDRTPLSIPYLLNVRSNTFYKVLEPLFLKWHTLKKSVPLLCHFFLKWHTAPTRTHVAHLLTCAIQRGTRASLDVCPWMCGGERVADVCRWMFACGCVPVDVCRWMCAWGSVQQQCRLPPRLLTKTRAFTNKTLLLILDQLKLNCWDSMIDYIYFIFSCFFYSHLWYEYQLFSQTIYLIKSVVYIVNKYND